jgi:hypothetical protein
VVDLVLVLRLGLRIGLGLVASLGGGTGLGLVLRTGLGFTGSRRVGGPLKVFIGFDSGLGRFGLTGAVFLCDISLGRFALTGVLSGTGLEEEGLVTLRPFALTSVMPEVPAGLEEEVLVGPFASTGVMPGVLDPEGLEEEVAVFLSGPGLEYPNDSNSATRPVLALLSPLVQRMCACDTLSFFGAIIASASTDIARTSPASPLSGTTAK